MKTFRFELVENWRSFHKFWSIRIGLAGSLISGVFIAWPDWLLQAFQQMPPDVRILFAPKTLQYIGLFLFIMSMIARLIKQRAVEIQHGK